MAIGVLLAIPFVLAGAFVALATPIVLALTAAIVGLGAALLVSARSPRAAVAIVFAASMLGGLTFDTPIGVLRVDQAIILPALFGVLARWVSDRQPRLPSSIRPSHLPALCLGLYILVNLVSTLLMAHDISASLRIVLWLVLSFAAYLLTILVASRYATARILFDDAVAIGTMAACAAVLLYALAVIGYFPFGVQTDPYISGLVAKGTFHEGNLLGSFAAMTTLLALAMLIHLPERTGRRRTMLIVAVGICAAVTFLSFTRAAWLGLALGTIVVVMLSRPSQGRIRTIRSVGFIVTTAMVLIFVLGWTNPLLDRTSSIFDDSTGTIAYRAATYAEALRGISEHLLIGLGTNSYGQYVSDPTQAYNPAYLGGLFIATLWDTGVAGFGFLLLAFGILARRLWRALVSTDDVTRSHAVGLSAAFVCALVAYQSTNGFWFAYNWIFMGIAAAVPSIIVVRRRGPSPAPEVASASDRGTATC